MREKLQRFMAGRYGSDQLNKFLFIVILVILIASFFVGRGWLYFIGLGLLIYAYYRMLSRNIAARYKENEGYLRLSGKVRNFFAVKKSHFSQRKNYRFYRCPKCGQQVRVPKGKGHIRITCPKCRAEFDKTT